jgi:hypothetical protein
VSGKFDDHMGEIAHRLLGEPNPHLSTRDQLRFGKHGSVAVEIAGEKAGTWYDHEHSEGGGALDLIRVKTGLLDGEAAKWLRDELGIDAEAARSERVIDATYKYDDEDGKPLFEVVRYNPKDFRQRRPDGKGDWIWSTKGTRMVPYRLPQLLRAVEAVETIFIAEGEKAVDILVEEGLTATCSPGGAGKWRPEYGKYFAGADVVILPDNDSAGRAHADQVARALSGTAQSVKIVDLAKNAPALPEKGDAYDWICLGRTVEDLKWFAEDTEPYQPPAPSDPPAQPQLNSRALFYRDLTKRSDSDYIVKGVIERGAFCEIRGPVGARKSFLAIDLGLHVALGRDWRGRRVHQAGVLYVSAEGGANVRKRMDAFGRFHKIDLDKVPFAAVLESTNLLEPKGVAQVIARCRRRSEFGADRDRYRGPGHARWR